MNPTATQPQVTFANGQYDTPIGMSGKIDTKSGQLIPAGQIGSQPVVIPGIPPPTPAVGATVPPPAGTVTGTDGTATIPPPPTETKSASQGILDQISGGISALGQKGAATQKLQEEQQLAQKTTQATQDYNAYAKAKLDQAQTIEQMRSTNAAGQGAGASANDINEFTARSNANLANLAVQAQASQGLLTAAEKTIQDKLDAQFKPIEDQIKYLGDFYQLNQNDLTSSEKIKLQAKIDEKTADAKAVRDVANQLHQAVLDNGGNTAVLSAMDKVTQDYQSGKISAQEAQSRYYSAAGKYGGDILGQQIKQLQAQKLGVEIKNLNNPGGPGEQLYSGLSSATATAVRSKVGKFSTEPIVQNFATIQDGANFAKSIADDTKNPADDQALIYSLAKALDPGSVVREGEYNTAQKYSQSWINAYGKGVEQAIYGTGFLSTQARKNIKKTIEQKYLSSKQSYDQQLKTYTGGINALTGRNDGSQFLTDYVTPPTQGGSKIIEKDGQAFDASDLTLEEFAQALQDGFTQQ